MSRDVLRICSQILSASSRSFFDSAALHRLEDAIGGARPDVGGEQHLLELVDGRRIDLLLAEQLAELARRSRRGSSRGRPCRRRRSRRRRATALRAPRFFLGRLPRRPCPAPRPLGCAVALALLALRRASSTPRRSASSASPALARGSSRDRATQDDQHEHDHARSRPRARSALPASIAGLSTATSRGGRARSLAIARSTRSLASREHGLGGEPRRRNRSPRRSR